MNPIEGLTCVKENIIHISTSGIMVSWIKLHVTVEWDFLKPNWSGDEHRAFTFRSRIMWSNTLPTTLQSESYGTIVVRLTGRLLGILGDGYQGWQYEIIRDDVMIGLMSQTSFQLEVYVFLLLKLRLDHACNKSYWGLERESQNVMNWSVLDNSFVN